MKAARGHTGGYAPLASSSQANMSSGPQSTFLLCGCSRKQPSACRPPWTHRLWGGALTCPWLHFTLHLFHLNHLMPLAWKVKQGRWPHTDKGLGKREQDFIILLAWSSQLPLLRGEGQLLISP